MEQKKQEVVINSTVYQLIEVLGADGKRVWTLNLQTPSENLIDNIMSILFLKEKN